MVPTAAVIGTLCAFGRNVRISVGIRVHRPLRSLGAFAVTAGESQRQFRGGLRDHEVRGLHHRGELLYVLDPRLLEELLRPRRNRTECAGRDPLRLDSSLLHQGADLQLDLLR